MKTDLLVIHCDHQVVGAGEWENRRKQAVHGDSLYAGFQRGTGEGALFMQESAVL